MRLTHSPPTFPAFHMLQQPDTQLPLRAGRYFHLLGCQGQKQIIESALQAIGFRHQPATVTRRAPAPRDAAADQSNDSRQSLAGGAQPCRNPGVTVLIERVSGSCRSPRFAMSLTYLRQPCRSAARQHARTADAETQSRGRTPSSHEEWRQYGQLQGECFYCLYCGDDQIHDGIERQCNRREWLRLAEVEEPLPRLSIAGEIYLSYCAQDHA